MWEWTADIYVSSYAKAPTDGHRAVTGSGHSRVIRGGSWRSKAASYLRSANRSSVVELDGNQDDLGFRLVRVVSK